MCVRDGEDYLREPPGFRAVNRTAIVFNCNWLVLVSDPDVHKELVDININNQFLKKINIQSHLYTQTTL